MSDFKSRAIEDIFENDRTCYKFLADKVDLSLLHRIYNLIKFGPTSSNTCPLRVTFCTTDESRQKVWATLSPGNLEKTKSAPVTAIMAYDSKFYDHMGKLFSHDPKARDRFASNPSADQLAMTNSWLQIGYFITIARAFGLACGPMGGFDKDMVNDLFFKEKSWKSIMLCNIGYKDQDFPSPPRLQRLDFDEACCVI